MSRLLARIMLALLMLPLAATVYAVVIVVLMEGIFGYSNDLAAFMVTNLITAAFVGIYWTMLWHRTVRWSTRRITLTITSVIGASVISAGIGASVSFVDDSFAAFVGGVSAILLWLTATVFIWRETTDERAKRLRSAGTEAIVCPSCGYNLTGVRQTACPECGASYTIDELVASQPSREPAEIDQ
ncbi:MAG: hypothetical protein V3T84_00495 [Phycisphaerales bacterium]